MNEKVAPSAEGHVELHSPWADKKVYPGTPKNAQCPCGSGRKYKVCHGRNEGLPDAIEVVTAGKKAAQNLSKLVKKSQKANEFEAQEEEAKQAPEDSTKQESSATEDKAQEEN